MVRLVLPRRGGGHINRDLAPGVGAAGDVRFPDDGVVDQQLLEMVAGGGAVKSSRSRKRSRWGPPGRTVADWLARTKSPGCDGVLHG